MTGTRRPLLVTGLPRSGTSWVGKMLELSGRLVYINEPLNPGHPPGRSPGVLDAQVTHRFQYISPDGDEQWLPAFRRTAALHYGVRAELRANHSAYDLARMVKYASAFAAGRLAGRRALLDDPFAVLSVQWFAEQLGCDVVLLVRDPVALVGSWKKLGWTVHFHELLEQPLLVRDHLGPYVDRMRASVGSPDWLARVSLLWEATYASMAPVATTTPRVHLVRYEDLAGDPVPAFEQLYGRLALPWSAATQQRIRVATTTASSDRAHAWTLRGGVSRTAFRPMDSRAALQEFTRRLSPEEGQRVRALTARVAAPLGYGEVGTT